MPLIPATQEAEEKDFKLKDKLDKVSETLFQEQNRKTKHMSQRCGSCVRALEVLSSIPNNKNKN
jgi:hypothetical protein